MHLRRVTGKRWSVMSSYFSPKLIKNFIRGEDSFSAIE
jgi:hypothetical protein